MADFQIAFRRTLKFEGVDLSTIQGDAGGLTFCGIARNEEPQWPGWAIVDSYIKQLPTFRQVRTACINDLDLMALMQAFYRQWEWDAHRLGELTDQELANQVYDAEVNMGDRTAIKALQTILEVTADGKIGPMTLQAANARQPYTPANPGLVGEFLDWRIQRYRHIVANNQMDQKFLSDWLSRCVPSSQA